MTSPAPWAGVRWRYTFCDLLTDTVLAELPLTGVDLTEVIGGVGEGAGKLTLTSPDVRQLDPWSATTPRRTICYAQRVVYRDGVEVAAPVMWHGIVWGRTRTGRGMTLKMATPESYWARRRHPFDRVFTQVDDAAMLRQLVADAESIPRGSLGITYTDALAGVLSDRQVLTVDLKSVLDTLTSIATAGAGLDWRIRPGVDPVTGRFTKTLDVAPRLGRTALPELRWQTAATGRGRNEVIGYTYEEDGSAVPNDLIGLGDGQGEGQLRSQVTAAGIGNTEAADGFPLLEASYSGGGDLKTQATLDRHVVGKLAALLGNERRLTGVTVRGDHEPTLDRYELGDEVTVDLNDPLHRYPIEHTGRLVARRIVPAEQGSTERVAMTLGET